MNVFRKCLCRELGDEAYRHYVEVCEKEFQKPKGLQKKIEEQVVYKEMLLQLCKRSQTEISLSGERLVSTLYSAFLIGKRFLSVTVFYAIANLVVLLLELDYTVTCVAVAMMGVCFLYKLVEFLSNKYCFMDAYLIMVYKSVLEKLAGHTLE